MKTKIRQGAAKSKKQQINLPSDLFLFHLLPAEKQKKKQPSELTRTCKKQ